MYVKNDIFSAPKDKNTKIWRYMDFTKFVALLTQSELFFASPEQFDDPCEGSLRMS